MARQTRRRRSIRQSARSRKANGSGRSARKVRYAVVGLGHIAQVAMLPAVRNARRNSELVALVSDDEQKLKTLGRRYKVPYAVTYDQADALFRTGEIDAVYIALPNDMHAEWAIKAAKAGLHVLCEKPMATNSADAERMIDACSDAGVKLMVAYRLHFERANLEVADLVRKRRIGDAKLFGSQFAMQVKQGNIRTQAERGGGPEWDIGIYCINAARYEIVGTKGAIVVDPAYEYAEGIAYELTIGEKKKRKQLSKSDQFAPELIHFSDCVLKNKEPEPSGKEGLIDVRIIEAIHRSIRSGRWENTQVTGRSRRPTLRQEIRRPGIQKPDTVNVQQPH